MTRLRADSESSIDEAYFLKTYVPLSNLPTPPLGYSSNNSRQQSPETLFPGEVLDPELLGPAVHLTNLIPSATSLTPASVPLVQSMLARANLPLETIALAVCILDSLNSRFALAFRHGCPLTPPAPSLNPTYFHNTDQPPHIDSIHPELLILSALILAVKFLEDEHQSTAHYAINWGMDIWTYDQINYAQRSILDNIGYKIKPLWDEEIISDALRDMKRAGEQYEPRIYDQDDEITHGKEALERFEEGKPLGSGKAIQGIGEQMTPAETPVEEYHESFRGLGDLSLDSKKALPGGKEAFPNYVDPGI